MFTNTYKPTKPEHLIGQQQRKTAQTLLDMIAAGEFIPPQLFFGPSGCGKTTVAHMIQAHLGDNTELIHYNCGDLTGVSDARDVIANFATKPLWGGVKVYLFDEVHRLSTAAQDAFLVPLDIIKERELRHTVIIAATTSLSKVQDTFASRFTRHNFRRPADSEMVLLVKSIAKRESITIKTQEINDIIRISDGNLRQLVLNLEEFGKGNILTPVTVDDNTINFAKVLQAGNLVPLLQIEGDYSNKLYQICDYAIKVLISNPQEPWARRVLLQFGPVLLDGKPIDRVAFATLMVQFVV